MSKKLPTSAWSYKAGEKGRNRVRVFEWPGNGVWIDYKENCERHRKPIGHSDRARAKQLADEVAAQLGAIDQTIEAQPVVRRKDGVVSALTWGTLFEKYEDEVTATKGWSKAEHDRRARQMFEECWGVNTLVADGDRRLWDRFTHQRRAGILSPKKVKDGTIALDFRYLLAVIHWAETVKEGGRPLVAVNPFKGFPVPGEDTVARPNCTDDEVRALRRAAPKVHPLVPLFLELAHETGKRSASAIARLRWSDVDLKRQDAFWRAENDKVKNEHRAPVSDECAAALRRARKGVRAIGDTLVFPSSTDPSKPVSRDVVKHWWRKLEQLSGIERVAGRGWHSLCRKFATDLAEEGVSLKVIMDLRGWKNKDTVLKYIQPSESNLRSALDRRSATRRRANGQ